MALTVYSLHDGAIRQQAWEEGAAIANTALWMDLLAPTLAEEKAVEAHLHMAIPTLEEMGEIELSNRLYEENDAQFMTATMMSKVDSGSPETHAVTFILANHVLVTVRYVDTTSFRRFAARMLKHTPEHPDAVAVLLILLDTIVNRIADILERIDRDINRITKDIFRHREPKEISTIDYQLVLERIGRCGDLVSKVHESLVTLDRVAAYASHTKKIAQSANDAAMISVRKDLTGLSDHGTYLTGKVNFLLDATLGMISIEQNGTIKIFSIAAVVFLPPTLVASVYGMNFKHMPELEWMYGYPLAIALMLLAAILPVVYFKQRKWL